MKDRFVQIVLVAAALLISCNKNEVVIEGGEGFNMPSVASTLNAFSYSVNAQRLGGSQTIPLTFNKNRLFISAAVSNLTQGQAIFALRDVTSGLIHADTFRLAGMYQVLMVVGLPASITVSFQNFSGNIQYALAADSLVSTFSVNEFPNTRGTFWVYLRHDSVANRTDSVRVHVHDQVILPGGIRATVWQRVAYPGPTIDTLYVMQSEDTIRILREPEWVRVNTMYVFPFVQGRGWRGEYGFDSSTVMRMGTVTTSGGTFARGFLLVRDFALLNEYGHSETWLVPNVGIVKLYRREHLFSYMTRETWELLQFHITASSE